MVHGKWTISKRGKKMGKRFDSLLFPGKKSKVFTLSYDDGVVQDRRLVQLFDQYGVKCTFNLGYGVLGYKVTEPPIPGMKFVDISKVETCEVKELYANHEVGGHSLYHSDLTALGSSYAMYEILEDKVQLERLTGYPLKMFAYPFGLFNDNVKEYLRIAGYKGARTVRSTYSFDLPSDPMQLDPTCHHKDGRLMELAARFVEMRAFKPSMFYVWGHGYEFDADDNWQVIEDLVRFMSVHGDDVWFATNGEILSYLDAYNRLEYNVDGSMIFNPSDVDVLLLTAFNKVEVLKAGENTLIGDTPL